MDDDLPADRWTIRLNLHTGRLDVKNDATSTHGLVYQTARLRMEDRNDVEL